MKQKKIQNHPENM